MNQHEEQVKYCFIPDDTNLDHNPNCRECLELFNCKMIDEFTLLGTGPGKYYRVTSRRYMAPSSQEAYLAQHFSINVESQNNLTRIDVVTENTLDREFKCPYYEENRRYFVKNISAVEISQEDYFREKYHLR